MLSRVVELDRNWIAGKDPGTIPTVHELLLPAVESPVAELTAELLAAESVAAGPVVERATALPGVSLNRKLSTKLRRKPWRSTRGGCVVLQINMVRSEDVLVEGGRDSRRPHGIRSAKDNRKKVSKDDAN